MKIVASGMPGVFLFGDDGRIIKEGGGWVAYRLTDPGKRVTIDPQAPGANDRLAREFYGEPK